MASATNLSFSQVTQGDASLVYAKRNNITVPGADQTDTILTTIETSAALRETEQNIGGKFAPDAADYQADGSERSAP